MTEPSRPPDPLEYATRAGTFGQQPFRPADTLAFWAKLLLWAWIGSSVVSMVLTVLQSHFTREMFRDTAGPPSTGTLVGLGLITLYGILHFAIYAAAITMLMIWLYRVLWNLRALGKTTMFGPGLSVGMWFIPLMNFVMPPLILAELLKKSDRTSRQGGGAAWIYWLLLFTGIAVQIAATIWLQVRMVRTIRVTAATTQPDPATMFDELFYTPAVVMQAGSYLFWVLGLFVLIGIVNRVQRLQAAAVAGE